MGNVKEAEWSFWLTLTSVSKDFFSQTRTKWQPIADQVLVIHLLSLYKHFGESGGKTWHWLGHNKNAYKLNFNIPSFCRFTFADFHQPLSKLIKVVVSIHCRNHNIVHNIDARWIMAAAHNYACVICAVAVVKWLKKIYYNWQKLGYRT